MKQHVLHQERTKRLISKVLNILRTKGKGRKNKNKKGKDSRKEMGENTSDFPGCDKSLCEPRTTMLEFPVAFLVLGCVLKYMKFVWRKGIF